MIPDIIDHTERFQFMASDRDGLFFILLVDQNAITDGVPIEPLWLRACSDEATRVALQQWLGVRRSEWQRWGKMAEADGYAAFNDHIHDLIAMSPPGHYGATALTRLDDERQIELGMHLATADVQRVESVYVHTFATAEQRKRFLLRFHQKKNRLDPEALVRLAFEQGTLALAAKLDAIADGHMRKAA